MPDGSIEQRLDWPLQTRAAPVSSVNETDRTVDLVWSTGAVVRRYDWWNDRWYDEELSMDPAHVRMGRLQSGRAALLDAHWQYSLAGQIGVVESAAINRGEGTARVRLSKRTEVEGIWQDIVDRIIRSVSVGYTVHRFEIVSPAEGSNVWTYRAIDWEPTELSLVPVGADSGAEVRSAEGGVDTPPPPQSRRDGARQAPTQSCLLVTPTPAEAATTRKEPTMPQPTTRTEQTQSAAAGAAPTTNTPAPAPTTETAEVIAARAEGARAERARQAEITRICSALELGDDFARTLISEDITVEQARVRAIDERARASAVNPTRSHANVETVRDAQETRLAGMTAALVHRINPTATLEEIGREFRSMSLIRIAEECLTARGVRVRGMAPIQIAERALMSGSDFASVLAAVTNKRLRQAYDENVPSYTRWARRAANAMDFKAVYVTQLSGAPDLIKVNEAGEIKFGSLSDGKETYQLVTYGRRIAITRQAIVNDDMRAFERVPQAFSAAARRLENRLVYAQLTANAAMADTVALFHSTHANLAASGGAISATTLAAARTAMRLQKGLQSEELNLAPRYLIVPATQEQLAYQFTSNQFVPAQPTNVNEFREGGRTALEPIVEAVLDASSATRWYLAADNNQVDTVEFCFLEGAEGVRIESAIDFDTDGMQMKAVHDFAAKVIDYRGLYSNPGA